MIARAYIFPMILLLMATGCSNTRFLTEGQVLYTGREKPEIIYTQQGNRSPEVKKSVESITLHKVNNSLFGRRILPPVGLWVHNYWKVEENKKMGSWAHKTLASSPILLTDVNPELKAKNLQSELFDLGYFRTRAWAVVDTSSRNPHKARVKYFVEVEPPFHYGQIMVDTPGESVDSLISPIHFTKYFKPGDQFKLDPLITAREELSRDIQDKGYFYFTPEFIAYQADTSMEGHVLNLKIGRKMELPPAAISKYRIGEIVIYLSGSSDSASVKADTVQYDGIKIISAGEFLKPDILGKAVYFHQGDIYTYTAYQQTISRLNSLGVFNYARISYGQSKEGKLENLLDVRIDLVMSKNISVDFEADVVTKSSGYLGPQLSAGVSHSNVFKGAERIHVQLNGGFEWQWGDKSYTELGTISYNFGLGTGLAFPKIILPGSHRKDNQLMIQQTSVNFDLDLLNRTAYYSMLSLMTELNYKWGKKRKIQHSFSPVHINSVNLQKTTAEFDSVVDNNIYIRKSFEEQFIIGLSYQFSYDNTLITRPHNIFWQAGISTSGNALDLVIGIGKKESERPYSFLNNIYSQHIKLTTDFRYYLNRTDNSWVVRLYAGLGIPYGNSEVLPYVEQFFSGGAYSIRGFTARHLGPGSFHEVSGDYIDQSGDIKLEGNMEYRFGISKILKGALFLETGNIWLANEDDNRPGSKFNIRTFQNQLAVGTGFGLRFDFTFFVLRTDLGIPLRNPYSTEGKYWLPGTGKMISGAHFYLAIGYPF